MPNDMMELLLRDISPTEIQAFARAVQTPANYELTQTVMPERTINSVKWETRGNRRRIAAASYRAWDAQTKVATREITQFATSGKLLPLGQKYIVGEFETILESLDRGMDSRDLVNAVYDDVGAHVLSIKKRLELAVGDLLKDGKFTLTGENGLTIEADYNVPTANMPTAPTAWTDPTADMLGDEMRWMEVLRSSGAPSRPSTHVLQDVGAHDEQRLLPRRLLRQRELGVDHPHRRPRTRRRQRHPGPVQPPADHPLRREDRAGQRHRRPRPRREHVLPAPAEPHPVGRDPVRAHRRRTHPLQRRKPRHHPRGSPGIVVTRGYQDDPPQVWTKGSAAALPVMYTPDIHIAATVW